MTPEQQAANLRSAANLTRTQLNLPADPQTWTLDQRAAYNKALAAQILKYPGAFSQEVRNQAATANTEYGLRGHYFDSALGTAASSVAETAARVNPLSEQNLPTVARWVFFAALFLAGLWLILRHPPAGPRTA